MIWPTDLYQWFNYVEAIWWFAVAVYLMLCVPRGTFGQQVGVVLGMIGFVLFGLSDVFEVPTAGRLPGWLWGLKIGCGAMLIAARFTYIGWRQFSLRRREVVFAAFCLLGVIAAISLERWLPV